MNSLFEPEGSLSWLTSNLASVSACLTSPRTPAGLLLSRSSSPSLRRYVPSVLRSLAPSPRPCSVATRSLATARSHTAQPFLPSARRAFLSTSCWALRRLVATLLPAPSLLAQQLPSGSTVGSVAAAIVLISRCPAGWPSPSASSLHHFSFLATIFTGALGVKGTSGSLHVEPLRSHSLLPSLRSSPSRTPSLASVVETRSDSLQQLSRSNWSRAQARSLRAQRGAASLKVFAS